MKHFLSVRSYSRPTVDILLNGKTVKRFKAETVDAARQKARTYAQKQGIIFDNHG